MRGILRAMRRRVLDLGCGRGCRLESSGTGSSDAVVGVELLFDRVKTAQSRFPERGFVQARGEALPFPDGVFDLVVSQVALPYMNIPAALREASRVLVPGGEVYLTLHAFRFTVHELTIAFPKPKALLFRMWVMLNGLILHFTGKPANIKGRYESFQTVRGISRALARAGFEDISVSRPPAALPTLAVKARKAGSQDTRRSRQQESTAA